MARPEIQGLKYFPLDIGFFGDKKVRLLRGEHGADGIEIYMRLLCKCYEDNGYYLDWDSDEDFSLFADETGYSDDKIRLVVATCLRRSLFDNTLFKVGNVLTSRGIQRRYFSAIKDTRMKAAGESRYTTIRKDLCLLTKEDFSEFNKTRVWLKVSGNNGFSENNPDKSEINPNKSPINPAKKSKVKKSNYYIETEYPGGSIFDGYEFSETLKRVINDWLVYKKERRQQYQATGVSKLLSRIQNKLNEYTEQQLIVAINESMANNYQGIAWEKTMKKNTVAPSKHNYPQRKYTEDELAKLGVDLMGGITNNDH